MCVSNSSQIHQKQKRVRSRHETVNKNFKQWGCLKQVFQHAIISRHDDVLIAVAIVTQICIKSGECLFNVEYDDDFLHVLHFQV
jgi:hypothetical protein